MNNISVCVQTFLFALIAVFMSVAVFGYYQGNGIK